MEKIYEIKQGWPALVIFLALGFGRFVVEDWFGKGWAVAAAVMAALAWFIIRPWRFGLLSNEARRGIRLVGALALCGLVAVAAVNYWRYGSN